MTIQLTRPVLRSGANLQFDLPAKALDMWNPGIRAAASTDDNEIGIFEVIGEDFWTGGGVTAARINAALRNIGAGNDVIVNINSPGGDLFEGVAIYSLLKEHAGHVTVKVMGLAASAASIIAMAADEIQIARAGFFMIHNAWTIAIGNRHDLRDIAEFLEPLDAAMADVYVARTGVELADVQRQMDAETWIGGSAAVERGFADSLLPSDEIQDGAPAAQYLAAARELDVALAKSGMPRSQRRKLLADFKSSTQSAAGTGTPRATNDDTLDAVEFDLEPLPTLSFNP